MMASRQGVGTSFQNLAHRRQSKIERLKTAARMAAVGIVISVAYVACIALLVSPAYHLA